jgi:hypothetical protein
MTTTATKIIPFSSQELITLFRPIYPYCISSSDDNKISLGWRLAGIISDLFYRSGRLTFPLPTNRILFLRRLLKRLSKVLSLSLPRRLTIDDLLFFLVRRRRTGGRTSCLSLYVRCGRSSCPVLLVVESSRSICFLPFIVIRLVVACDHAYHEDCIADWLARKTTCPSCRQEYLRNPNDDGDEDKAADANV